jgi:tryptophan synthase alpha chain
MSHINSYLQDINDHKRKALSVFITAGFPDKKNFVQLALDILESGADMLELGIPFSDPIADGPVIQHSSQFALKNGITLHDTLNFSEKIKSKTDKPIILMGYSNPLLSYGLEKFIRDARNAGVDGLIIPDVPLEEHDQFWNCDLKTLDVILLTTPTSTEERIRAIDSRSNGFVYCVSVTGTTGVRRSFDKAVMEKIAQTYATINKNKMLIGFGISTPQNITEFAPYCDGVIVGSAVVKSLMADREKGENYQGTMRFIRGLSEACGRKSP